MIILKANRACGIRVVYTLRMRVGEVVSIVSEERSPVI